MQWLLYGLTIFAGVLNAIQPGCNATLNKGAGIAVRRRDDRGRGQFHVPAHRGLALRSDFLARRRAHRASALVGLGGWRLGAVYVMSMLRVAERVGAALFLGLTVTAAIITSLVLDHYGLVGFRQHPVNARRVLGAFLMIGGLGLIAKL